MKIINESYFNGREEQEIDISDVTQTTNILPFFFEMTFHILESDDLKNKNIHKLIYNKTENDFSNATFVEQFKISKVIVTDNNKHNQYESEALINHIVDYLLEIQKFKNECPDTKIYYVTLIVDFQCSLRTLNFKSFCKDLYSIWHKMPFLKHMRCIRKKDNTSTIGIGKNLGCQFFTLEDCTQIYHLIYNMDCCKIDSNKWNKMFNKLAYSPFLNHLLYIAHKNNYKTEEYNCKIEGYSVYYPELGINSRTCLYITLNPLWDKNNKLDDLYKECKRIFIDNLKQDDLKILTYDYLVLFIKSDIDITFGNNEEDKYYGTSYHFDRNDRKLNIYMFFCDNNWVPIELYVSKRLYIPNYINVAQSNLKNMLNKKYNKKDAS